MMSESKDVKNYWEQVQQLLDVAGKYSNAVKLRENLKDESTAWKVEAVFNRYYGGSSLALDQKIKSSKTFFFKLIPAFNVICRLKKLPEIKRPETLFNLLTTSPKRLKYYRRQTKRFLDRKEIVALQTIETEYRRKKEEA